VQDNSPILDLDVMAKAGYALINNLRLKPEVINIELFGLKPYLYLGDLSYTPSILEGLFY